jgi:hypothetical protein
VRRVITDVAWRMIAYGRPLLAFRCQSILPDTVVNRDARRDGGFSIMLSTTPRADSLPHSSLAGVQALNTEHMRPTGPG